MRIKQNLIYWVLVATVCCISACSSDKFMRKKVSPLSLAGAYGYGYLPDLSHFDNIQLAARCTSYEQSTTLDIALALDCYITLLKRDSLSDAHRAIGIDGYNLAVNKLFRLRHTTDNLIQVNYSGPSELVLVSEIEALDARLSPKVFGELGGAAVARISNQAQNGRSLDLNYPLEGIYSPYSLQVESVALKGLRIHISLQAQHVDVPTEILVGNNTYTQRYSPAAAYLSLLQNADIHNFSWLGFINAQDAEKRMGVFSIGELSSVKTPIIMIHGLNSDPLIWRYLTMAIFNDEELSQHYQILHVYYPSGPPPFYNAMRVRNLLYKLNQRIASSEGASSSAVLIGHSMGGVIAKLISTHSDNTLWDTTFTEPPEALLAEGDEMLRDIFIFNPVYKENTVFFLDTPHRGSEIANSLIGSLGSSLITLPFSFKALFKNFIEKVGVSRLTSAMLPFLQNYGPDSVQVLRPNHPLMTALADIPVEGESYSIIGSTSTLYCQSETECAAITDSVVSYSSAYLPDAKDTTIVNSSHNSFKSTQAIEFILDKLRQKHISAKTVQNSLDM